MPQPVQDPIHVAWATNTDWRLVIGGRKHDAVNGRTFVIPGPPVSESELCALPDADPVDVDGAVCAGQDAQAEGTRTPVRHRARVVRELASVVRDHRQRLAVLDVIDVSNTHTHMLQDVELGTDGLALTSDFAIQLRGSTLPATGSYAHMKTVDMPLE